REAKHEPRSEAQQRQTWRADALEVLGSHTALTKMVTAARAGRDTHGSGTLVTSDWVRRTTERIVDIVQSSRSSWQVWHVRAEALRQVRGVDRDAQQAQDLVEHLTRAALTASVPMRAENEDRLVEPEVLRRADGSSVYSVAGSQWFTSTPVLGAEQRLV